MSELRLILKNPSTELTVPLSKQDLARLDLDFSFDNFSPNQNLIEDIIFEFKCTGDQYDVVNYVNNHINQYGAYNGIDFLMQDLTTNETYFTGVVDLLDPDTFLEQEKGEYSLKFKPDNNNIFDIMRGLDLRSLNWSPSDYRIVETVLNNVPDTREAITLLVMLFIIQKELSNASYQLTKAIADAAGGITGFAVSIAKIGAATAYFAFVVFSAYKILQQLSDAIFSKIKNYYVIEVKTLLTKACESFGYTFTSTALDKFPNLVILSRTNEEGAKTGLPTNNPIPNKNLLQQIEDIGALFYAKPKVDTNAKTIELENIFTYIDNPSNFILNDLYNNGSFGFNFKEVPSTIKLRFLRDTLDTNTYLRVDQLGINLTGQEITSNGNQISVNYEITDAISDKDMFKDDPENVIINYARGYRKEFQSNLEKLFNSIYDIIGTIKSVFGSNSNGSGKIGDRIGRLLLSNDYVAVDKIFMINDIDSSKSRQLSSESFFKVHAENLFNEFYIRLGLDQNQWYIYSNRDPEPICSIELTKQLRFNNVARDYTGRTVLVESNIKNMETELHTLNFRRQINNGEFGHVPSDKIKITRNYGE